MGITMEIYLADQEAFVSLQQQLASESLGDEEAQPLFNQLVLQCHLACKMASGGRLSIQWYELLIGFPSHLAALLAL